MKKISFLGMLLASVLFFPLAVSAVPYVYFFGNSYTPSQEFDDGDVCNISRQSAPNHTDTCFDLGGNFNGYYAYVPSQNAISGYYPTIGACRADNPLSTCFVFSKGLSETCSQGLGACIHSTTCPSSFTNTPGTCPPGYSCCEPIDRTCSQAGGACVNSANCPTGYDVAAGGICAGGYTCCEPATSQACVSDLVNNGSCHTTCPGGSSPEGQGDCPSGQLCCVGSVSLPAPQVCYGEVTGSTGICEAECDPSNTTDEGNAGCSHNRSCCVASAPPGGGGAGTCEDNGGTCRSESPGNSSPQSPCPPDESKIAGDCGNGNQQCCKKNESGSGDPGGGSTASGSDAFTFNNPLEFNTVQGVLGAALTALRNVIVLLALVFLVLGAVLYIVSGGSEKSTGAAKKMILAAMIGLALGIAAPSFLREIAEILNWGGDVPPEVQGAQTLSEIAGNLLNFLLSMVGILGIVMIVFGGLMYFAAAGDEKRADTAKKIILYSIIGVAVALTALIIVRTIASFFVAG